jgi:hypothetical protein
MGMDGIIWKTTKGFTSQQSAINSAKTLNTTQITYSTGRRQFKPYTDSII